MKSWADYHNFPRFFLCRNTEAISRRALNCLSLVSHRTKSFHYSVADYKRRNNCKNKLPSRRYDRADRNWKSGRRRRKRRRRVETSERDLRDVHGRKDDYWEEGLVPHCVSRISLPHNIYLAVAPNFFHRATNVGIRREGHSPLTQRSQKISPIKFPISLASYYISYREQKKVLR